MATLDTLTVRFEADAQALFNNLDSLETRLKALKEGSTQTFPAVGDMQFLLTVTADEAIAHALKGAGDTLSNAVLQHETQFSAALQAAQQAMASALQSAVDKLAASINITVPVSVDGQRLATAAVRSLTQRSLTQGLHTLL